MTWFLFFYDCMSIRVIGNVKTYFIIYYLIRNSVETQTSALLFHMTWAQQSLHVTSDFWCSLGMPGHQWEWSCTVAMVMEKHFSAISCVNTKSFSKSFSETDYIQLRSCTLRWTHQIWVFLTKQRTTACFPNLTSVEFVFNKHKT